jgi:MtrB/PioB family decaheme-associated outer membrane protein
MRRGIGSSCTGLLVAVALSMLAGPARADEDAYHDLVTLESNLELGFLYSSADSYKFGDYTDLTQDEFSVLGNADIRLRSPYDADLPYYLRLRGMNLGIHSRRVDALIKMPGRFGLSVFYDEIPKFRFDDGKSPYLGVGGNTLTLPPGWDPGTCPQAASCPDGDPMTTLQSSLRKLSIAHQRHTLGGAASVVLGGHLDFDASYKRESRNGRKITSGVFGNNGGDPRSILIPEPIDYVTQQIDSHLRFQTDRFQIQLQYYGSLFENDEPWLRWQNPYCDDGSALCPDGVGADPSWDPAAQYPAFGQKGVPPDNWFHQGVLSAGVNLPLNTRVMVNTAFGWGRQTEEFLPYTLGAAGGGPGLAAPVGLPRHDLNGKIRTGMASFRLTSNPLPKLGILLAYRWDERDNDTPVDVFSRVLNDTTPQDPENRTINRPYGWDKQHVDADLSYRILSRTKLTLSYDFEEMDRTYQEVDRTTEHTWGVKLVSQVHRRVRLGGRFQRGYRNAHGYDCVAPWVEATPVEVFMDAMPPETPGCSPGLDFENHPDLRKFHEADRIRTSAYAWSNLMLMDDLLLTISGRYAEDDYNNSDLGLTNFRTFSPGFDLSYTPREWLSFSLFYQYEETRSKLDSVEWPGFAPAAAFDPTNQWSNREKDIIHTAGAGMDLVVVPGRLTFGLNYLFARSRGIYVVDPGTGNPSDLPDPPNQPILFPFPDAITELHDVSVKSELTLTENFSLRFGYLFEHYRSRDWAVDNVCPACLDYSASSAVIATGQSSPDYNAHVGSVSVILHF